MNVPSELLTDEIAIKLIQIIRPASEFKSVKPIAGGYSNHTHLIEMIGPNGANEKIVIRRYSSGNRERRQKAVREFKVLEYVRKLGIPAPEPLFLDQTGDILEIPGIVTNYIEGESELRPSNPKDRAAKIAEMLIQLHAIPLDPEVTGFLFDANSDAAWFLRDIGAEEKVNAHPLGLELLNLSKELFGKLKPATKSIVHTDIWPGNIIWQDDIISGIVDWDDAGFGDPALDVGYAMMELSLAGYFDAAGILLREYEKHIGREPENLRFWQAAAAIKPIYKPHIWDVLGEPRKEHLAKFIKSIL